EHFRRQRMHDIHFEKVGLSDGGRATNPVVNSKRLLSRDSRTSCAAEMAAGMCGNPILSKHANAVATTMPQRMEPRTRRACNTAVVNIPTKKTMQSGDAKCAFSFTAVPG